MADHEYDFCVQYCDHDTQRAYRLLTYLEGSGYRGYMDERDGTPGISNLTNLEKAIEKSRFVLLLISTPAIRNNWWEFKAHVALQHRLENPLERNTIIPILMPDFDNAYLPSCLKVLVGIYYNDSDGDSFWNKMRRLFQ